MDFEGKFGRTSSFTLTFFALLEDLNAQMLEYVRSNPELKTLDTLLQSVPGVGPIMSATLLSSLPELGGTSREATAFPLALDCHFLPVSYKPLSVVFCDVIQGFTD